MPRPTVLVSLLVLAVAPLADPALAAQAQDASPAALPPVLADFGTAWSSGDPERVLALYAEDALFEVVVLGGAVTRGRDELRAYAAAVYAAFPDFASTPTCGFVAGDRAVVEWVLTGTYTGQFGTLPPGTGQQVEVRVASVLELEGGLIRHDAEYWDLATLLSQLGLLPGGGAPEAGTPAA